MDAHRLLCLGLGARGGGPLLSPPSDQKPGRRSSENPARRGGRPGKRRPTQQKAPEAAASEAFYSGAQEMQGTLIPPAPMLSQGEPLPFEVEEF